MSKNSLCKIVPRANYLAVLWLGGRSCSGSCWFQTWYIGTACRAVAERTVWIGWLESDNYYGPALTPLGIEVLSWMAVSSATVMQVAIPSGNASQDALNGAALQRFEDLRAHAESFQPPEGEEALSCPLHDCVGLYGAWLFLSDMATDELESLNLLHYSPVDVVGSLTLSL
jgi:hypothetical protein